MFYYEIFVSKFPTVHHLAKAKEDTVMKTWQGLGYYSRARNLHYSAKFISKNLQGVFPKEYEEIKKLKGIGDYTASAIASFAFNKPHAVVDGNVFRILSRYFGLKIPIDSIEGKSVFTRKAESLLDKSDPGTFNQAIMEFGAIQCIPQNPDCNKCPLKKSCKAFAMELVSEFPVKSQRTKVRTRYFNYFIIRRNNKTLIKKRTEKDIWQNMYDFPMVETKKEMKRIKLGKVNILSVSKLFKHILSHQIIFARFWEVACDIEQVLPNYNQSNSNRIYINDNQLNKYPFPRLIEKYFEENSIKKNKVTIYLVVPIISVSLYCN